jgi:hypothetical protein
MRHRRRSQDGSRGKSSSSAGFARHALPYPRRSPVASLPQSRTFGRHQLFTGLARWGQRALIGREQGKRASVMSYKLDCISLPGAPPRRDRVFQGYAWGPPSSGRVWDGGCDDRESRRCRRPGPRTRAIMPALVTRMTCVYWPRVTLN